MWLIDLGQKIIPADTLLFSFSTNPLTKGCDILERQNSWVATTQGLAAKALNAYPSNVSAHLKGKLPDVNGHHLVHVTNPLPTQPVKVTT